jgi:hypothetical protein
MKSKTRARIIFEGGLGSQLLPLIEALKMHSEGNRFETDYSYFFTGEISKSRVQRPWRLDRYGFDFEAIAQLGSQRKRIIATKNRSTQSLWSYAKSHASKQIPISREKLQEFLALYGLDLTSNFSAVHIRRGDYLKVSSKVISDDEVAQILTSVSRLLDREIFIISDSKITLQSHREFKKLQKTNKFNFHFISGTSVDECTIHDLMRMANFLVCSNSTFSFSAAVLSKQFATSIAPIDFFDPQTMQVVNEKFRSAGNFFILNQS